MRVCERKASDVGDRGRRSNEQISRSIAKSIASEDVDRPGTIKESMSRKEIGEGNKEHKTIGI